MMKTYEFNRHLASNQTTSDLLFRRANVPRTRDGVDLLYLKNVVIKGYETGEVQRLLDVLSTLLQFTPDEDRRARKSFSRGVGSSASSSVLGLIPPGSPFAKLFGS